jgi:glycosyltransferase involved in cell wall biosynthesis
MRQCWAILTGEYPPDPGGVSDYTRLVARGLAAAGDEVRVFAPPRRGVEQLDDPGVLVHRLPGWYGPRSLHNLDRALATRPRPDRILVQYVPNAFGFKAMNLPFATWVATRLRRVAPVWVMFHEVIAPFRWRPASHALLGAMTRVMARLIAGAAERVFVSIPAWGLILAKLCPRARPAEWSPVPCTIDGDSDADLVAAVRNRYAPAEGPLVGHFGTYGQAITDLLKPAALELLRLVPAARLMLVGRGSEDFLRKFVSSQCDLSDRVVATKELSPSAVSAHICACDLLIQPYPDGVSTRRTSAMTALANGVPLVTNLGGLSEPLWAGGIAAAAPNPDGAAVGRLAVEILSDLVTQQELGRRGVAFYRDLFALEHTISRLRTQLQ